MFAGRVGVADTHSPRRRRGPGPEGCVYGGVLVGGRPSVVTGPRLSVLKDASVRMKCILALKALYEKRESAMKLGLFFHKFKVSEILRLGRRGRQPEASPWTCGPRAAAIGRLPLAGLRTSGHVSARCLGPRPATANRNPPPSPRGPSGQNRPRFRAHQVTRAERGHTPGGQSRAGGSFRVWEREGSAPAVPTQAHSCRWVARLRAPRAGPLRDGATEASARDDAGRSPR